ncbi:MAG TPA: flavin reductase family protein [Propionicimonas sp.]|nr:flavin reductase family protein [Propionicimonas sp.]HRA07196.1 flavin reductase family protein [Propionicimonas sp.]
MTIHHTHPFADPNRDAGRLLRGRLAVGVTLWTSMGVRQPAGLTVSSVLIANGEQPRVLALLDPLSDLAEALAASGTAAVSVLNSEQQRLAEVFAGQVPAPGGQFRESSFVDTEWGPVPADASVWAGVRLERTQDVGWSQLVTCALVQLSITGEAEPLVHYRGRYRQVPRDAG